MIPQVVVCNCPATFPAKDGANMLEMGMWGKEFWRGFQLDASRYAGHLASADEFFQLTPIPEDVPTGRFQAPHALIPPQ
ncbi:MAG: hypothetical protein H6821_07005 [Planctomycetaceae bacterium]|nr:hypothetical protein [Planctomycetales bacterium]MCB9873914.1 hypothetical protein [Planctomycetaceae bacterium]